MLQKTPGIVLRTVNYSETSIICDAYTLEWGLCTFIVNGVRKKKPNFSPAILRVMSILDLVVYYKASKEMHRIKEAKAAYVYQQLPYDIKRGTVGLFITEIIQKSIKEKESNPPLYDFIHTVYTTMDQQDSILNFPAWFMVHFSKFIGILPELGSLQSPKYFDYASGTLCAEEPVEHRYYFSKENSCLLKQLIDLDSSSAEKTRIKTAERRLFIEDMLLYYKYHIANFGSLKSVEILQTVFG
jgi:DNA repair protein RecO (recombination protein O)